jgi:hypothetical protein
MCFRVRQAEDPTGTRGRCATRPDTDKWLPQRVLEARGYYKYPCSTRHYLDVKLAMLHASNIKIDFAKRFLDEFCVK